MVGKKLAAQLDDRGIDLDLHYPLDFRVPEHLAQHAPVTTTDDEHAACAAVRKEGHVGQHLVVDEFVTLGGLDDAIEDENSPKARVPATDPPPLHSLRGHHTGLC